MVTVVVIGVNRVRCVVPADEVLSPRNGAEIFFALADGGKGYLGAVSGIGQEEGFYADSRDTMAVDAALNPRCEEALPALDRFVAAGRLVLVVDYLTNEDRIDDFFARARRRGYVPYAAPSRDLDRVAIPDGHEPE